MKLKKAIYVVVGCLGVGLGAVGAVVPMLPAFPFLMLAAFCFAKSSRRLHTWFTHTKLYRENLADYVSGQGMTWPAKKRVMLTVTLLMAFGFILMLLKWCQDERGRGNDRGLHSFLRTPRYGP